MDRDIQRNVQRDIIKNKGLTRKRKKEDRNPRVAKRRKYEEMMGKRKTVVKEYKGKEAKYEGEKSGIASGLKRSTRL